MDAKSLTSLAAELAKAGLPALAGVFTGPAGAAVASSVIGAMAGALGVPADPEKVKEAVAFDKDAAAVRLKELEAMQIAAQASADIARSEIGREEWWSWAWRPAMSWLIIVLWSYALLILPIINVALQAAFGLQAMPIQPIPMENLTAFTGIWIAAYSGGNTLIRVMGRKD